MTERVLPKARFGTVATPRGRASVRRSLAGPAVWRVQPLRPNNAAQRKRRVAGRLLRRPQDGLQRGDSLSPRETSGERGSFSADQMFVQCWQGFPSPHSFFMERGRSEAAVRALAACVVHVTDLAVRLRTSFIGIYVGLRAPFRKRATTRPARLRSNSP